MDREKTQLAIEIEPMFLSFFQTFTTLEEHQSISIFTNHICPL
jgi:hypothetical protein